MIIYAISISVVFPAGISANDSEDKNNLFLTRNGAGEFILPGTSIAGVLRHKWKSHVKDPQEVIKIFGWAAENGKDITDSSLYVPDAVLNIGEGEVKTHTYHRRNRHTGAVLDKGIFSIETTPPGTSTSFTLWLEERVDNQENVDDNNVYNKFIIWLRSVFTTGIIFGGNSNRGVGLAELVGCIRVKKYQLDNQDDHVAYLEDRRYTAADETLAIECLMNECVFKKIQSADCSSQSDGIFSAEISLQIPSGQDILISESGDDTINDMPIRVTAADGNDYWRLPGSTLHGIFRDWTTRLVALEKGEIADSVDNYNKFKETEDYRSDRISELFIPEEERNKGIKGIVEFAKKHPVANLFGSTLKAGRIHISDSFSKVSDSMKTTAELSMDEGSEVQKRSHVQINSFSGGTYPHSLFTNAVLMNGSACTPEWKVKILIQDPVDKEIEWLVKSLKALHIGLLRVGSSKSAGRLEITNCSVKATKNLSEAFSSNLNLKFKEYNNE